MLEKKNKIKVPKENMTMRENEEKLFQIWSLKKCIKIIQKNIKTDINSVKIFVIKKKTQRTIQTMLNSFC